MNAPPTPLTPTPLTPELLAPDLHPAVERLPGEPLRRGYAAPKLALAVALRFALTALSAALFAPLWLPYALSCLRWGRAPNTPRASQVWRYLGFALTADPPAPGLSALQRAWLIAAVLGRAARAPLWGLAWHLDELLYGEALAAATPVSPLIKISAARSGSTQLAHYLEADPHLVAPSALQLVFPYLWLWRLSAATLGRWVSPERSEALLKRQLPPEFLERHELALHQTDTFDIALYVHHLNSLGRYFGPDGVRDEVGFATRTSYGIALWEGDFVELFDGIGRRTLADAPPGPDGRARRLFIKGHFIRAADALAARYPDARFLTMLRSPSSRLRSQVNFMRSQPPEAALGPTPWGWIVEGLVQAEINYCAAEQAWFADGPERGGGPERAGGPRRTVLRFSDYVADLRGAMEQVYRECLDLDTLPAHVPLEHAPRQRRGYTLNRSLEQLGVDPEAYERRLADFIAWMEQAER